MTGSQVAPKVGVGVIVIRDGHVLIGKRKGSTGSGTWSLPGGNLEFGESFEQCAKRELLEETGLRIANVHFVWACNSVFDASTHYVTIFMLGSLDNAAQEPELREPDKCEGWQWARYPGDIPEPRFQPLQSLIDSGFHPDEDVEAKSVQLMAAVNPATRSGEFAGP